MNVLRVWEQYSLNGHGVHIRINDDGVNYSHPDLKDRFSTAHSWQDPMPADQHQTHGTACAGLAAASSNNVCSLGVAFEATLSGAIIVGTNANSSSMSRVLADGIDFVDVSSNSWGVDSCSASHPLTALVSGDSVSRRRLATDAMRSTDVMRCPFLNLSTAPRSPCAHCTLLPNVTAACRRAIREYCSDPLLADVDSACASHIDLFVSCSHNELSAEASAVLMRSTSEGRKGR
jgi:hypothetical protein